METVIPKRQKNRTRKPIRERDIIVPCPGNMTLEDVLASGPFTRKKHEQAIARLFRSPVPEELLQRLRNDAMH